MLIWIEAVDIFWATFQMQCQHQPLLEEPGIVPLLRLAESALQTPQPRLFELESLHSQGEEVLALVRQYGIVS